METQSYPSENTSSVPFPKNVLTISKNPDLAAADAENRRAETTTRVRLDNVHFCLGVLRHCLGLGCGDAAAKSRDYFSRRTTSGQHTFEDPVFVCLDTEGGLCVREWGVSILDTRDFKTLQPKDDLANVLKGYNYILKKDEEAELKRFFQFGTSRRLRIQWSQWTLKKILSTGSPDPQVTEMRRVILVGHNILCDLGALARKNRKLDMRSLPNVPIIDTIYLSRPLTRSSSPIGLMDLCDFLGVPTSRIVQHNAGNDANITMKAMIQLALGSCDHTTLTEQQRERVQLLKGIVCDSVPSYPAHSRHIDVLEYEQEWKERRAHREKYGDYLDACEGGLDFGVCADA